MVKIITDSSANISQEEAAKLGVTVLPLTIIFGGKQYRDGIDLKSDEFYKMLVSSEEFPHTAQISEEQLEEAYKSACADGSDVIVMPISKALSGSYGLACAVAKREGFEHVHVYNTTCTTIMLRYLVEEAAKNKDKTIEELIAILDDLRPRIKLYAALDTLEYLKKGGRLNSAVAAICGLLRIKPVITVNLKGEVELVEKHMGIHKALNSLAEKLNAATTDGHETVYIYTMDDANCRNVMEKTAAAEGVTPVNMCPVIGAHIGPFAAGVVYVEKAKAKRKKK
ncbi:MAG: DegV family protein [Clostridia bacterium]|nr:DegV family protein [Clostridia bacterium]